MQCQVDLLGSSGYVRFRPGAVIHGGKGTVLTDPGGNGTDAAAPAPAHVNGTLERRWILQMLCRMLACMIKVHGSACNPIRTLHQVQLVNAGCHALGQRRDVILHTLRKGLLLQPHPGKGMPLDKHQQSIQSYSLQTCCIQHRQIQTGAAFLLQHRMGQPHPLSHGFIACRGHMIRNVLRLQCRIDSCRLRFDDVGIPALVAGKGGLPQPPLQPFPCLCGQFSYSGMIGCHKGCNDLRHLQQARPLVIGKQGNGNAFLMQACLLLHHPDPDIALHPLRQ